MKQTAKNTSLTAVLALTATLWGCAAPMQQGEADNRQGGQKQDRRGPPAEAFEACAAAVESDSCTVVTPRGEVTGQCVVARDQSKGLVCQPEGMKKPQQ